MNTPPEALPRHELERTLRRSKRLNVLFGALAVLGLVFGGVQWFGGTQNWTITSQAAAEQPSGAVSGDGQANGAVQIERRTEGDPMAVGALDAPIVLSEWIDFRCPFCAVYSRDTLPAILDEYVETGKVRLEIHDVAFFGEESERAAVAARAAGEQGKYLEFVRAVYDASPESGHPELPPEQLIALAQVAGVPDIARFEADMQRADLAQAVRDSTAQAQQLGVNSVPFFAVNGQAISGAQPIATFRQFLDQQLAAS